MKTSKAQRSMLLVALQWAEQSLAHARRVAVVPKAIVRVHLAEIRGIKKSLALLALFAAFLIPSLSFAQYPGDPREPALFGTWTSAPAGLVNPHNLAVRTSPINSGAGIVVTFPKTEDTLAPYMDWRNLRLVRLQGLADALARKINFDFDSAELEPDSFSVIDEMATLMKGNPDIGLHLDGHTDLMGTDEYNDALSARRAAAVEAVLLAQGVEQDRLFVATHGESLPLIKTETKERENRRVEFAVVDLFTR
jgi:outer membrane protein OmpA-like peptidoglycan-associated protein